MRGPLLLKVSSVLMLVFASLSAGVALLNLLAIRLGQWQPTGAELADVAFAGALALLQLAAGIAGLMRSWLPRRKAMACFVLGGSLLVLGLVYDGLAIGLSQGGQAVALAVLGLVSRLFLEVCYLLGARALWRE